MKISLRTIKDSELLLSTKALVQREREVTMDVLRHLAEIERRKLYCDVVGENGLRCGSLFDYAVRELRYTEGAASRRIQALRLLTEIPELAPKIESGRLNLSNVCRAQSFFRDIKRAQPEKAFNKEEKKEILEKLEQKSSREGERILLAMSPPEVLPRERERVVSVEHTEVRLILNQQVKNQLQEVRALLGQKGAGLSLSELISEMAKLSTERLAEKRFGKTRVLQAQNSDSKSGIPHPGPSIPKPAPPHPGAGVRATRHIPRATRYQVWREAHGKCLSCGATHNLQYDHIQPFALGGNSSPNNVQLLCQACNLRRGIKTFGETAARRT